MMMPSASMSSRMVMKTKMNAAERAGAIEVVSIIDYATGLLHAKWGLLLTNDAVGDDSQFVMAGLVPDIHVFSSRESKEDVDARDKRGHDGGNIVPRSHDLRR